jgi:outer membrane protein assembly factor BamB
MPAFASPELSDMTRSPARTCTSPANASGSGIRVISVSLAAGAIEYAVTVGAGTLTGPLSGANVVLYVGSSDGHMYALAAADGHQLLARQLGAATSQSVIAHGRVFVGTPDQVLALGL